MSKVHAILAVERPQDEVRQLLLVSPETLPVVWDLARPMFAADQEHWEEFATLESIYSDLALGRFQLWLMNSEDEFLLAMLTEIIVYPPTKVMRILWMGGEELGVAIDQFLDFMELWAYRQGISTIYVMGRKGWVRLLRSRGYAQTQWIVSKDISSLREH